MKLKLCPGRVVIKPIKIEGVLSDGGIEIVNIDPTTDQFLRGEVIAVGDLPPIYTDEGTYRAPAPVKIGDIVLAPRYTGYDMPAWHFGKAGMYRQYKFEEITGVYDA